ncbi:hypothetical protein KSP40_PGU011862 [Platanthera guangdongensis]|uniref:Uncharacterized protein n=1 Tax=Platanthera guangdongensis TaxID=2320717 RepID=A0ABR2M2H5_9ASPA
MNPAIPSAAAAATSTSSSWLSGIVRGRSTKIPASGTVGGASPLTGEATGPGYRKNQLRGVLFKYGPKSVQVAFKTGDFNQQVIFLGGLADGLLATEYVRKGNYVGSLAAGGPSTIETIGERGDDWMGSAIEVASVTSPSTFRDSITRP